ncbi:hypothetical protein FA13DRAFT_1668374, partial [Coprinellus micaceus]
MVKVVSDRMKKMTIGNDMRREDWQNELEFLETEEPLPPILIAVCGATGAGKSSVLNAILQDNIVPTSGMRACTAVVTKISYHKKRRICATINFLTKEDWRKELEVLLKDLTSEDGSVPTNDSELAMLSLPAQVAWERIHAVYPTIEMGKLKVMSVQQIIDLNLGIFTKLDTVEEFEVKTSDKFTEQVDQYINSLDDAEGGALWPLIREVHIRCHADALSSGAVLVDLPGIADANAARNNVAAGYMKEAHRIWIVAPITRAVDDGAAQKLLGDMFKTQLLSDRRYNSQCITFIASKNDDVSCKEIITALKLRKDPALIAIDARISDIETKKKDLDRRYLKKQADITALEAELKAVSTDQQVPLQPPAFQPKKRKKPAQVGPRKRRRAASDSSSGSESDDGSSDEDIRSDTESVPEAPPETSTSQTTRFGPPINTDGTDSSCTMDQQPSKHLRIRALQRKLDEANREEKEMLGDRATLERQALVAQRDKNAFCSLARSKHAQATLKGQFRTGLQELHDKVTPDSFESIDLPVFTISSRDYVRLTKQVVGDGEPVCFTDLEDTGIPALQRWCHDLTQPFREQAALRYLSRLGSLALRIRTWVENIDARPDTAETRRQIRNKYQTDRSTGKRTKSGIALQLSKEFTEQVVKCTEQMEKTFKEGIEASCQVGVQKASNGAVGTVESLFKPWQTWKAVLRRRGDWERHNLNQMLLQPFMQEVASSFAKTLEIEMFTQFKYHVRVAIYVFLQDFENTANDKIGTARVSGPLRACQKLTNKLIDEMISRVENTVQRGRSDTSRTAAPCIKAKLEDAYTIALEETGTGSVSRQQNFFKTYVERHKQDIFESAASAIRTGLAGIVQSVDHKLRTEVDALAKKVEVDLAVLWEEVHETDDESEARRQ